MIVPPLEHIPASPVVVETYCPGCSPERTIDSGAISWCYEHTPQALGAADSMVRATPRPGLEMDPVSNKLWCDLIHRGVLNG